MFHKILTLSILCAMFSLTGLAQDQSIDALPTFTPYDSNEVDEATTSEWKFSAEQARHLGKLRFKRFLSVDRFAHKYPSMTPYQYAANSPIRFVDINGDSLDLAGDQQKALDYLQSLLSGKDAQRVSVDKNGQVSFNTKGLNLTGKNADAAAVLLNNMINGNQSFLFEVVPVGQTTSGVLRTTTSMGPAGTSIVLDVNNSNSGIENLSVTPRNNNGGVGASGLLPKGGYDGQTSLGSGSWTFLNGQPQPTSNIVFHELAEVYHRTANKEPYIRANRTGAHQRAIIDAQNFHKQIGRPGVGLYVP